MELKERLRRLLSSKRGAAVITALGAAGMLLIMVSELIPEGREEEREQPESTAAYADSYCAETEQRLECPVSQRISGILDEGYQFEIRHVNECLRNGLKESPLLTHAMTSDVLKMCDEIRKQWGLVYPFEV